MKPECLLETDGVLGLEVLQTVDLDAVIKDELRFGLHGPGLLPLEVPKSTAS
jgi:hypothetical protein